MPTINGFTHLFCVSAPLHLSSSLPDNVHLSQRVCPCMVTCFWFLSWIQKPRALLALPIALSRTLFSVADRIYTNMHKIFHTEYDSTAHYFMIYVVMVIVLVLLLLLLLLLHNCGILFCCHLSRGRFCCTPCIWFVFHSVVLPIKSVVCLQHIRILLNFRCKTFRG